MAIQCEAFQSFGIKDNEKETEMDEGRDQRTDDSPNCSEKTLEIAMDHSLASPFGSSKKRLKLAIPLIRRLFYTEKHPTHIEQHQTTIKNLVMDMSVREPMQIDSFESTDPKAFLKVESLERILQSSCARG